MKKLEICCYSAESAILAEKSGAHRIELCDNYTEGGTTPSFGTIKQTLQKVNIPVNVIVRPRGGDFLYSDLEYEIIKDDVLKIKDLKANGIVIGYLLEDGDIDIARTKEIVKLASPMEVTFHRAFDMCKDPFVALEQLKDIGITRILTSGTKNTAIEGSDIVSELVQNSENKIIIMPGSGINIENLQELIIKTNAQEYHCSAKTFKKSSMNYFNKEIYMGGNNNYDEFSRIITNGDQISKMINILNSYS